MNRHFSKAFTAWRRRICPEGCCPRRSLLPRATLLFPHAKVVIHHIDSQTVVHFANNFSRRTVGDHSAIHDQPEQLAASRTLGPYEKHNWTGQKIRSITSVLKNAQLPQPDVLLRDDWQERINTFLQAWLSERQLAISTLGRKDKRALVEALYVQGAFEGRSGADYVANVLSMGRATVYKYLRTMREQA